MLSNHCGQDRIEFISLTQAARLVAKDGRSPHPNTLRRWISKGVTNPSGSKTRLHAIRRGGAWVTTAIWVENFLIELNDKPIQPPRSPATRSKAAEQAEARLNELGINLSQFGN